MFIGKNIFMLSLFYTISIKNHDPFKLKVVKKLLFPYTPELCHGKVREYGEN
ncbi:hypothetical protein KJ636_03470 [Patescibacteria group bacterium]|nr:hypothetical protein [Patescibacteria group bacterium]